MRRPHLQLGACLLSATLAGCDPDEGCTLVLVPGIAVDVRDRITNEFLATTPRGVVVEGTFVDSLRGFSDPRTTTLYGAHEQAGTYVVRIEADGYLAWDTAGIRITKDECHVRTVRFTAALEPIP